jgi:type VI secretion system protein VasG
VLLDEIEKAHPDVHEIFFQVFDKGWMEDGQGVRIDFRNSSIILTSNVGRVAVLRACEAGRPSPEQLDAALRPALTQAFPAALLGRMIVVPYYPLSDEVLERIVALQLGRVSRRVRERYGVPLDYDQSVVDLVRRRCTEVESGGRTIDAFLTNSLLPDVSRELLLRTLDGRTVDQVRVRARAGALEYRFDRADAVEAVAVAG